MRDCSFMVAATALWNSLPLSVRQAKDIDSFKGVVKNLEKLQYKYKYWIYTT